MRKEKDDKEMGNRRKEKWERKKLEDEQRKGKGALKGVGKWGGKNVRKNEKRGKRKEKNNGKRERREGN